MEDGYSKIEVFADEDAVFEKVKALTAKGIDEGDIYIISEERKGSSKLADRTNVNYQQASGSIGDKFSSFFSGYYEEEPEDKVLKKFNLNLSERDQLIDDLLAGKILLYVDPGESDATTIDPKDRARITDDKKNNTADNARDDDHLYR